MKRGVFLILVVALYGITAVMFWATSIKTLTLYPTKDSYSWESVPKANNGHSDNFEITSYNKPPYNMRGWIEFNSSSIPSNAWILSGKLRLRLWAKSVNDPSQEMGDSTGRTYGVYRLIKPWNETGVNWLNQPNFTEEHHATAQVPQGQGGWNGPLLYMEWDTTDIVKEWQSGVPNDGLVVRDTEEYSPIFYTTQFFTHDQVPNESYYPQLVVTYVFPVNLAGFSVALIVETYFILAQLRLRKTRAKSK